MKRSLFHRSIAVCVALVMLFQLCPVQAMAVDSDESQFFAQDIVPGEESSMIVGEVTDRREESVKHFHLEDGSFLAVDYGIPVHYEDTDGQWVDIDNTLTEETSVAAMAMGESSSMYLAANGEDTTAFAQDISDGFVFAMSKGDVGLTMSLAQPSEPSLETMGSANASEALVIDPGEEAALLSLFEPEEEPSLAEQIALPNLSSQVLYEDVYEGVDLQYDLYSTNVKESIIVKEPLSSYRFQFQLELEGLTPALREDGSIDLLDGDTIVYQIPAPYMLDASMAYSDAVSYALETSGDGTWLLTVTADSQWIEADDRAWPVTIDPTIIDFSGKANLIFQVSSENNNYNNTNDNLCAGYHYYFGQTESYFIIDKLIEVPADCTMVRAYAGFRQSDFYSGDTTNVNQRSGEIRVFMREIAESVDLTQSLQWADRPELGPVLDYVDASYDTIAYTLWDVTPAAKQWYNSDTQRGLALVSNADSIEKCRAYYDYRSTVTLVVSYRSTNGIEPYYTYQTAGVGNAGTAYIGDYSGRLTVSKHLASYASTINPVAVEWVYNSGYTAPDTEEPAMDVSVGTGGQLNIMQRIWSVELTNDAAQSGATTYLVYSDGDGTEHYFRKDGSYYLDEDGLGLKIKVTGTGDYEMSDDSGNLMVFNNHFLSEIRDANGNKILIYYSNGGTPTTTYSSGMKPHSVVQKNSGGSEITAATFGYTGNRLTSVTNGAGIITQLGYSEDGMLTSISYDDAAVASYCYNDTAMTCAYDEEADYGIGFAYGSDGKVSRYHEVLTSGGQARGIVVGITHDGSDETVYRSYGVTSSDEDDIYTHYLFDYAGRSANAFTTDADGTILGASNAVYSGTGTTDKGNNRTLRTASIGSVAKNLLTNGNCEGNSGWTVTSFGYGANKRTGTQGMESTSGSATAYQTVTLQGGVTYTFSGYVATHSSSDPGSVYLEVFSGGTRIAKSNVIDHTTFHDGEENWTRISCSFTPETTGPYKLQVRDDAMPGSVYVDDLQLEVGNAPSNVNLLEGGDFESGGWTLDGITGTVIIAETTGPDGTATKAAKILGDTWIGRNARRTVELNLPGTQTYVVSGWGKADALPTAEREDNWDRAFAIRVKLFYAAEAGEEEEYEYHQADFNPDITGWQYTSLTVVPEQPEKTVSRMIIVAGYERNANTAYFDNFSLVLEPAQTMVYNEDGELTSVQSSGLSTQSYTYSEGDLIGAVTEGGCDYTYTYDDNHNLLTASNGIVTQTNTYSGGNIVSTMLQGDEPEVMSSRATYSADGNRQTSVTDTRGNTTSYHYATDAATHPRYTMMGLPIVVNDALGTSQTNIYDNDGKAVQQYIASISSLDYSYSKGNLTQVTRGGWTAPAGERTAANKLLQRYTMAYDEFGQMTRFYVGGSDGFRLVSNTYDPIGRLTAQTYGNGDVVTYTYDHLGRMVGSAVNGVEQAAYHYSTDGKLSAIEARGQRYQYIYDSLDRLIYSGQSDLDGSMVLETRQEYDDQSRLTQQTIRMGSSAYTERYVYDEHDRLESMTAGNGDVITIAYDGLNRVETVATPEYDVAYTYADGVDFTSDGVTYDGTSALVSGVEYEGANGSTLYSQNYTYDALGRISGTTGGYYGYTNYSYDTLGQLTGETNNLYSWTYQYDTFGNILSVKEGSQTQHTFTYGNSTWRDLLTAFDGETILYEGQTVTTDAPTSGNPTSYYNGTRWAFDWDNGRQLVSAESEDYGLTFEYDHNGIRTSKTETVHTYELIEHEWTVTVVEPTCTDDGYTLNECSCGNSYISDETTALGHDYTETTSGNDTIFTCSVCGHSYTQHTHNYSTTTVVAPTCTAKGYTLHECACGHSYKTNETAALGHNFQLMVCTRCGYRQGSGIIQPPVQPPVDIMSLDANETELVDGCEQYRITSTTEVRHDYIYASGKLLRETITTTVDGTVTDTDVLDFFYNQNGQPYSFTYNGTEYFYILNLQGDVERIYDTDGEEVALYNYNAWGEVMTKSGTMADVNPIRYRGYYYDSESGFYYLQSRYYDPEIGRFINVDVFASTGQDFIGYNMFAYCNNNPIAFIDVSGSLPVSVKPMQAVYNDGYRGCSANSTGMMTFYGTDTGDETPELPDNAMAFVENIHCIPTLSPLWSFVYGRTVVMDENKYCVYTFRGFALGVSGFPFDVTMTKGYVYGIHDIDDYCGAFWGASANMLHQVYGGALASKEVYAEIISGSGYLSASISISLTNYETTQSNWIYGSAPVITVTPPYGSLVYGGSNSV